MGCLGAYFCGDFEEIGKVIGHRLRVAGRSGCLAVIVFANAKTELFKTHISPYLGEWHYKSFDFAEFVFPGYQGVGDPEEHNFKAEIYEDAYQDSVFSRALATFESRSEWHDTGEPVAIICNASISSVALRNSADAYLSLESCVVFDLAEAFRKGTIDSVPRLFQCIIRYAKENPNCATAWDFSDVMGTRLLVKELKEGLVKSISKWLKLEDTLPKALALANCFAIRNLEPR